MDMKDENLRNNINLLIQSKEYDYWSKSEYPDITKVNESFKIPKDCPFILEHCLYEEKLL